MKLLRRIWPKKVPLRDNGSLAYAVARIGPPLEPWSAAERAMMVQQFEHKGQSMDSERLS